MSWEEISVDVATRYSLEGPGIESRWWLELFRFHTHPPWKHPVSYNSGYGVIPEGNVAGAWR